MDRAAALLQAGELVVMPTDTVYGLAARADLPDAMAKLYAVKQRDATKPVALLVADWQTASRAGARFSDAAKKLAAAFWPGALTLVLPAAGGEWLGLRVPDHPVALAVLRACGGALAVSSANRSGGESAQTALEAWAALAPHPALVLDAGPVMGGVPSAVVRVEETQIHILRPGPIPAADLARVSGLRVE